MADIQIKIKNLAQIKSAFAMSPRLMTTELDKAIAKSLFVIEARSKQNTPVDTGRLRASTKTVLRRLRGEVGTHTEYDVFVHDGTKFTRGRPYLLNAAKASDADVQRYFLDAVNRVLSTIGRATQ